MENVWRLTRESESKPWSLADGKPAEVLDVTKAAQTVEMLNFLGFVDVSNTPKQNDWEKSVSLLVETFDHFFYTLKIAIPPKHEATYEVTIGVRAEIGSERSAGAEETADEKKRLDEAFEGNVKRLREKFAREVAFAREGWSYVMEARLIDPLICDRASLLEKTALAEMKNSR